MSVSLAYNVSLFWSLGAMAAVDTNLAVIVMAACVLGKSSITYKQQNHELLNFFFREKCNPSCD